MRGHIRYLWIIGLLVVVLVIISLFFASSDDISYLYDVADYQEFSASNEVISTTTFHLEGSNFNVYVEMVKNACNYDLDPSVLYDVLIAESNNATYISFFISETRDPVCVKSFDKVAQSNIDDSVIAMVGQQPIYMAEFQARFNQLDSSQQTEESANQILQNLIDEKILIEEARTRNITIQIEDLNKAYLNVLKANNMTDSEFITLLQNNGISKEQYLTTLGTRMIVNQLLYLEVYSKVAVSDQDVGVYYQENPEQFNIPRRAKFRQILFNGYDTQEALAEDINMAISMLNTTDFCDLVVEFSKDSETVESCGGYDVALNEIIPSVTDSIIANDVGNVFLSQSQLGYHLIVLDDKSDYEMLDFESVKDQIYNMLLQKKSQESYSKYIASLREKYLTSESSS